jgi:hypothetical protein
MRRAVLAVALLLAVALAFSAPTRAELQRRSRLLMRAIRAQASAPKKDTARLRAELKELKAENDAAPDDQVGDRLRRAEANLGLVEEGSPLPPADEAEADDDPPNQELPDRDAVAQPSLPARAPGLQAAAPAALPESANHVFDGAGRFIAVAAPSVAVPSKAPAANLDAFLELADDSSREDFLKTASADLLGRLKEKDEDAEHIRNFHWRLERAIAVHPKRASFISLSVRVPEDAQVHLVYRVSDAGAIDEVMGPLSEWIRPGPREKNGRPRKKTKTYAGRNHGGDDGGDGGGSSSHGARRGRGHKKSGGAGGGGAGDDGGGGGGGGGAGRGGKGSHHAKAPSAKGGGSMFDGGGADGDSGGGPAPRGGGMGSLGGGRGGRGHRGAASSSGDGSSGEVGSAGASGSGSGHGHARAGHSISGDGDGPGSHSGSRRTRGARVPLPKDFTTRGGGLRLDAEGGGGGGGRGGFGGGNFGGGMGPLVLKDFHRGAPPTAPASHAAPVLETPVPKPVAAASSPAAAASAGRDLDAPLVAETDLRDAVAGHAAPAAPRISPRAPLPPSSPAAPPASEPWPVATVCAALAGLAIAAYAFRRSRRA